jgi:hypothetical protein
MNKNDIQLNSLIRWVNVKIAPSEIDGVGIFALKDITAGSKLYMDIMPEIFNVPYKKLYNNTPAYIHDTILERWPLVKQDTPFVYPDARYVAYCNHSDGANYDAENDVALRDIKAGEEITEDYRKIEGHEEVFKFLMV